MSKRLLPTEYERKNRGKASKTTHTKQSTKEKRVISDIYMGSNLAELKLLSDQITEDAHRTSRAVVSEGDYENTQIREKPGTEKRRYKIKLNSSDDEKVFIGDKSNNKKLVISTMTKKREKLDENRASVSRGKSGITANTGFPADNKAALYTSEDYNSSHAAVFTKKLLSDASLEKSNGMKTTRRLLQAVDEGTTRSRSERVRESIKHLDSKLLSDGNPESKQKLEVVKSSLSHISDVNSSLLDKKEQMNAYIARRQISVINKAAVDTEQESHNSLLDLLLIKHREEEDAEIPKDE